MFAIVQTGGKQYRVEKGRRLVVEKITLEPGSEVSLNEVLLVSETNGTDAQIGQPFVSGAKVLATVVQQVKAPKIIVFKKRSKKGYKKTIGHRQHLTEIEIKEIVV